LKKALIRADGSLQLGLGHVMRCIGLAQGLAAKGIGSFFVTRNSSPVIKGLIDRHGFSVELMPDDSGFERDLEVTSELAKQRDARLVVTDLSADGFLRSAGNCKTYLKKLKEDARFLISIDDLNVMDFPSDIVVNPNYGAEQLDYGRNSHVRYLLGPAYFIFRREFIDASGMERTISAEAKHVLVTLGGSDSSDLTFKVLKALNMLGIQDLEIRILPGANGSSRHLEMYEQALRGFRGSFEFCSVEHNMAELMLWADLAITGGGLTKYETAVTGTPSVIITRIKHQKDLSGLFAREGSTVFVDEGDHMSAEEIANVVSKTLRDRELRSDMSIRGKKLVDGRGVARIISEIPREILD